MDDEHAMNLEKENRIRKEHRKDGVKKRLPQSDRVKKALKKLKNNKNDNQTKNKKNDAQDEKEQKEKENEVQ